MRSVVEAGEGPGNARAAVNGGWYGASYGVKVLVFVFLAGRLDGRPPIWGRGSWAHAARTVGLSRQLGSHVGNRKVSTTLKRGSKALSFRRTPE